MRVSWMAFPHWHSLVSNRLIRPWKLIPAWFALSLAMPAALAQAPALAVPQAAIASVPPAEEQPNSATPGGPHESVKVHGHWVIEVKNPDGSLAQRHEFENSLQSDATKALSELLLGNAVPAGWFVSLQPGSASTNSPCGKGVSCILIPAKLESSQGCPAVCSNNLAASAAPGGFTLSGWIQAKSAGSISNVATAIYLCTASAIGGSPGTTSPSQCQAAPGTSQTQFSFTFVRLPATNSSSNPCGASGENSCEITGIQANQMINVSVAITFQ